MNIRKETKNKAIGSLAETLYSDDGVFLLITSRVGQHRVERYQDDMCDGILDGILDAIEGYFDMMNTPAAERFANELQSIIREDKKKRDK